jgi:AraC-like DNA-binding protein
MKLKKYMVLQVRNMESDRCITVVKSELDKLGVNYKNVDLGEVEFVEEISSEKLMLIDEALRNAGLEILDNKGKRLVDKIKAAVHNYIILTEDIGKQSFSEYIKEKVNYDYTSLSNLFSDVEGVTIEKYYIEQRVERCKELLSNQRLTISEISYRLQYSSVGHLSNQFKKVTGYNPSCYRKLWYNVQQSS